MGFSGSGSEVRREFEFETACGRGRRRCKRMGPADENRNAIADPNPQGVYLCTTRARVLARDLRSIATVPVTSRNYLWCHRVPMIHDSHVGASVCCCCRSGLHPFRGGASGALGKIAPAPTSVSSKSQRKSRSASGWSPLLRLPLTALLIEAERVAGREASEVSGSSKKLKASLTC